MKSVSSAPPGAGEQVLHSDSTLTLNYIFTVCLLNWENRAAFGVEHTSLWVTFGTRPLGSCWDLPESNDRSRSKGSGGGGS